MTPIIPDYATPLKGYRSLRPPARDRRHLRSAFRDIEWPTAAYGGMVAQCHLYVPGDGFLKRMRDRVAPPRPCWNPPGDKCRSNNPCGIYAYRTPQLLEASYAGGPVYVEVELGGKIWTHAELYRAQYARISAIYDYVPGVAVPEGFYDDRRAVLADAAELYEVPLVHWAPAESLSQS